MKKTGLGLVLRVPLAFRATAPWRSADFRLAYLIILAILATYTLPPAFASIFAAHPPRVTALVPEAQSLVLTALFCAAFPARPRFLPSLRDAA